MKRTGLITTKNWPPAVLVSACSGLRNPGSRCGQFPQQFANSARRRGQIRAVEHPVSH